MSAAETDALLAADPFAEEIAEARWQAYRARLDADLDAETAPAWAGIVRCGGDALDREVSL